MTDWGARVLLLPACYCLSQQTLLDYANRCVMRGGRASCYCLLLPLSAGRQACLPGWMATRALLLPATACYCLLLPARLPAWMDGRTRLSTACYCLPACLLLHAWMDGRVARWAGFGIPLGFLNPNPYPIPCTPRYPSTSMPKPPYCRRLALVRTLGPQGIDQGFRDSNTWGYVSCQASS